MARLKEIVTGFFGAALFVATGPSIALAGGAGGHSGIESLFYPAINFAMYLVLLRVLLKKPFAAFLEGRRLAMQQQLEKAGAAADAAQARLTSAQRRSEALASDIAALQAAMQREAKLESEALLSEAERRAARIAEQSRRSAEAEQRGAETQIRRELAEAALGKARERLAREVDANRDRDLRRGAAERISQLH